MVNVCAKASEPLVQPRKLKLGIYGGQQSRFSFFNDFPINTSVDNNNLNYF